MNYEGFTDYVQLYFTTGVRWVFVGLAILILLHQILGLLRMRNPSEIWAYLRCPDGSSVPLTHWENLVGRSRGCDIKLNLGSVSRSHGTLMRDSTGTWIYNDLNSKNGSKINGIPVHEPTVLRGGDVLNIGGSDFELYPLSLQERMQNVKTRKQYTSTTSPWFSLFAITIFQLLTVIQFHVAMGENYPTQLTVAYMLLCAVMWGYTLLMRSFRRKGFEVEIIAFFLSTLSLAVTASAYPTTVLKQSIAVMLGVILFIVICWFLRDLRWTKSLTTILLGISVVLLLINLIFGAVVNGSQNWIHIGSLSFQPSEIVKIVFVYIGAATLDELQQRKNLMIFMGFSVFCLGCLALMGDFGTAIVFFATFLIISFLRSGDFTKLALILGAAGLMGLMVLRFKPYVASRFEVWGHVWEDPTDGGFQQVQTLTSIASGGLPGLGAGEGNLSDVAAASTDLVFGMLSEEWGLVIAVLAVLCIITLGVFAQRAIRAGRSTYYCIAACAATSLFLFQVILNVFGSVDLLPLTGVTFPFVSSGGTSMITCWGLLAFVKAADTRQNASFAIRLDRKSDFRDNLADSDLQNPEDLFEEVDSDDYEAEFDGSEFGDLDAFEEVDFFEESSDAADYEEVSDLSDLEAFDEPASYDESSSYAPPKKERVRAVRYTDVSDDDFFGKFEKAGGSSDAPEKSKDRPLTLDDLFGKKK
ncbi:MAG: FtsW/RodA/SpoVE family cell cycle protein [Firmicutes bacterium]|nr:FtsW/RodA/SpoVE family cell cycle protein [Bacillota bacterium]